MRRLAERRAIFGFSAAVLVGCSAQNIRPVVDSYNVDMNKYQKDLAECQTLAEHENPVGKALASALLAGAIGAATGAALGAPTGNSGYGAQVGATAAGVAGGAAGGAESARTMKGIVYNCLRARGYNPLDG